MSIDIYHVVIGGKSLLSSAPYHMTQLLFLVPFLELTRRKWTKSGTFWPEIDE